jgi:hypothetical protein
MIEPAVAASGASYERSAIVQWLGSHSHDPLTGRKLLMEQLRPNLNLHNAIEQWVGAKMRELREPPVGAD